MTTAAQNEASAWSGLTLLCVIAIVSDLSYGGLTPIVIAYETLLHFDLTTAGWLATAEGVGFTGGALLVALFGAAAPTRRASVAAVLSVVAVAQLLSALTTHAWPLALCRLASGTAAGLTYAIGVSAISASPNPDRGFAVYFGAIFVAGLIALVTIPQLLRWGGLRGFYLTYAAVLFLSVTLVRWYPLTRPDGVTAPAHATTNDRATRRSNGLLLAGLFLNFVFNGGLWVLAEHFGLEIKGTDPESLGALLAGTMLFALVGTGAATFVAKRWSHLFSIVLGNVALIVAVIVMMLWHTVAGLVVAMALLNMAVTILTPATLSALVGKSGHGAQWGNLASQAGYSVGPAAAAAIAAESGMVGLVAASIAGFVVSIILSWLALTQISAARLPVEP